MAYAKYTAETDTKILEYAENKEYKTYTDAFKQLINDLDADFRLSQITARYYKLKNDIPVANHDEDDPGSPATARQYKSKERTPSGSYDIKEYDPSTSNPSNKEKMKKTILVIYTNEERLSDKRLRQHKKYAFNTESNIKAGDIINSAQYNTPMLVTDVADDSFKYYNRLTGELSNTFNSTEQRELVTLVIREDNENVVYGSIKNKKEE